MTSQQIGEEVIMDEKYMPPVFEKIKKLNLLIKTQKYYISTLEELMDLGDHEKIKKLNLLIKLQKDYISNLEERMDLIDQLIKEYEGTLDIQEERIKFLENLLNIKDEQNKKLVGIIEDYKALCRGIAGLEDE